MAHKKKTNEKQIGRGAVSVSKKERSCAERVPERRVPVRRSWTETFHFHSSLFIRPFIAESIILLLIFKSVHFIFKK